MTQQTAVERLSDVIEWAQNQMLEITGLRNIPAEPDMSTIEYVKALDREYKRALRSRKD